MTCSRSICLVVTIWVALIPCCAQDASDFSRSGRIATPAEEFAHMPARLSSLKERMLALQSMHGQDAENHLQSVGSAAMSAKSLIWRFHRYGALNRAKLSTDDRLRWDRVNAWLSDKVEPPSKRSGRYSEPEISAIIREIEELIAAAPRTGESGKGK